MGRRPREDHPGSWHHVINRGIAKRPLFETRRDARFFLSRLARQSREGRIEIHAFCLLQTHFHLLVRSPIGDASEALRQAQCEHSRRFNRLRKRDGPLIRGRFYSRLVRSLEYRGTLVRYIDANPVRARVVAKAEEYELGSAAAYLSRSGPPWLQREWVEAEACRIAHRDSFSPSVYRMAFGPKGDARRAELVERRIRSVAQEDPVDDLVRSNSAQVLAWMRRKARLADGHNVGLPVCGPASLRLALEEDAGQRGDWMVEDGDRTLSGAQVAWHGLLRDLCCSTWRENAKEAGGSKSRAIRLAKVHRRLLDENESYSRRVSGVGKRAVTLSLS